jgi:hypothetical protein
MLLLMMMLASRLDLQATTEIVLSIDFGMLHQNRPLVSTVEEVKENEMHGMESTGCGKVIYGRHFRTVDWKEAQIEGDGRKCEEKAQ